MDPTIAEDFRLAHQMAQDLHAGKYKGRYRERHVKSRGKVLAFNLPKELAVDLYMAVMSHPGVNMSGAVQAGVRIYSRNKLFL